MTGHGGAPAVPAPAVLSRRVRRLLRWYPRSWRARYGEEFAELLRAELSEQPQAWRRTANDSAFLLPTSTTSFLPRVMAVYSRLRCSMR